MIGRENSKKKDIYDKLRLKGGYRLKFLGSDAESSIEGLKLLYADRPDDKLEISEHVSELDLVTISVQETNYKSIIPLLSYFISASKAQVLFIVLCENWTNGSNSVRSDLSKITLESDLVRTRVLDSSVDRICFRLETHEQELLQYAENYMEWCVDASKLTEPERASLQDKLGMAVNLVPDGRLFGFFQDRKRLLVNSIHNYIAHVAHLQEPPMEVVSEVLNDPDLVQDVTMLQRLMSLVLALKYKCLALEESAIHEELLALGSYNLSIERRFRDNKEDTVRRLLSSVYSTDASKYYEYFGKTHERISKPLEYLVENIKEDACREFVRKHSERLFILLSRLMVSSTKMHHMRMKKVAAGSSAAS